MCDIIEFPVGRAAARPDSCIAAVQSCGNDPEALFSLAFTSMIIVRSGTIGDPASGDFLRTAFLALSGLLDVTREARR